MLPEGFTNTDDAGERILNKGCHVTLYHEDRQLMPWHHVPPGAWLTLRRGLFTDDLYSTPAWSFMDWERLHLTDLQRIQSFHAFCDYEAVVQKDLVVSNDRKQRQQIIEDMGHKKISHIPKKLFGISSACLQQTQSPEDPDARLAPNGKLVKVAFNEAEFNRSVGLRCHHNPHLLAICQ